MAKNTHVLTTNEWIQTGWTDLRVSLARATVGASNPTLTSFRTNGSGSTGTYAYAFSKTTLQQLFFDVQLPHEMRFGGDDGGDGEIHPHIHWSPGPSTDTGSVIWGLEYTWAKVNGTFGTTVIDETAVQAAAGAHKHQLVEWAPIDCTGMSGSAVLSCRVYRLAASDDFDDVAFGLSIDFHFQQRGWGGITEYAHTG